MSLLLDDLLERCAVLDEELHDLLSGSQNNGSPRSTLIVSMCELVVEHGLALRMLIEHGKLVSAIALLRVQLDAIIRIVWIHYATSDEWVQAAVTLKPGTPVKDPTHDLTTNEMLNGIETKAPPELHRQLFEFKNAAWPALNSYIHSGIWPLVHRLNGNEVDGAIQTLRNSSGLTCMAAMMVAMHTGDQQNTIAVKLLQLKHKDCLPPLKESQ